MGRLSKLFVLAGVGLGGLVASTAAPRGSAASATLAGFSAIGGEFAATLLTLALTAVEALAPGLLVAVLFHQLRVRRARGSKAFWGVYVLAALGYAALVQSLHAPLPLRLPSRSLPESAPSLAPVAASAAVLPAVRSGEEVLKSNGSFKRVADPSLGEEGVVQEGWQDAMRRQMAFAVSRGEAQVVLMFTRQGCPECDRQLEVIRHAMQSRVGVEGGAGGNLLWAPVRLFVMDEAEFVEVAEKFKVQDFPTCLIFGRPQVEPIVAPGFVDEDTFDRLLRTVAVQQPGGDFLR